MTFCTQNYGLMAMPRSQLKKICNTHLNRNKIESNLSVPGIQGRHKNALIKSFEMRPHMKCLHVSIKNPLGPASGSSLDSGWP